MKKLRYAALLSLFAFVTAVAAVVIYYELPMTMTGSTLDVKFHKWNDGTLWNTVSMSYNIYADAWVVDRNATYGIKNIGIASKTVFLWVESVTDSSKFANYTVRILGASGSEMCKWTTTDFANVGEGNAVSWTANPNTVYTIYVLYKGSSTAGSDSSTVNLKLKTQA